VKNMLILCVISNIRLSLNSNPKWVIKYILSSIYINLFYKEYSTNFAIL
jgi:hypothetical protein